MYNLENLNDYEFEILAKDIMQKKLSIELHGSTKGKDGGIDICDSSQKNIIQVKHYFRSSWSQLRATLKSEVPKVEKLNPRNYYIVTSIGLTPQNKKEIIEMFPKYVKDISYIIDKVEIDAFLTATENEDILRKHFKLWFCSADFLNKISQKGVFIDCEELLSDINKSVQLFVKTSAYSECLKKISETNVLIITGSPGVGKSIISKMLVLNFLEKDYSLRYVSNNSIRDLKNSLSNNPEKKEIILLDDFLGQHYLNIKESTPNEIKALISYVENSSSKKIILNSRITILNEAKQSNIDFEKLMQMQAINNYVIDLDRMSDLEKAKILYNHLFFSNIPEKYFMSIKRNLSYEKIIRHQNYNPRIIEYVTNEFNLENIDEGAYVPFILDSLNNPDKVWDDEFKNRLSREDRIFMNTLYSLTDRTIDKEIVRKAFDKRIFGEGIATEQNVFDDVYKRLGGALIKTFINNSKKKPYFEISVVNPSVNDYLKKIISSNFNEQKSIVKHANYIEQVDKMITINDRAKMAFFQHDELQLESFSNQTSYFYLKHLTSLDVLDNEQENNVKQAFKNICLKSSWLYEKLLIELIEKGHYDFYNLSDVLFENLESALGQFALDSVVIIYKMLEQKHDNLNENIANTFVYIFESAIEMDALEQINDELPSIVENCMSDFDDAWLYDEIEQLIGDKVDQIITELIKMVPVEIKKSSIDRNNILYNIDIKGATEAFIKDQEEVHRYNDEHDRKYAEKEEWDIIHNLFKEE